MRPTRRRCNPFSAIVVLRAPDEVRWAARQAVRYPGDVDQQQRSTTRYRVYQVIGIVLGVLFLGLAAAAFFGGGGWIVAAIAAVGGVLCLTASLITLVRTSATRSRS
jgi:membrane associated rhomboid family serine protease